MGQLIFNILSNILENSRRINKDNILSLLERNPNARLLDIGCNDGSWTMEVAKRIGTSDVHGVDIDKSAIEKAERLGIEVRQIDLNESLSYEENSFDVVHSHQVIEHLFDVDNFLEEIYRVVKPGGYVVIGTENLSSWDNIAALVLGRQAFSQHISTRVHIGNPFSLDHGKTMDRFSGHIKIFTYYGLREFLSIHFHVERLLGAGYIPFPTVAINRLLSAIDPVHTRLICAKARK